MSTPIQMGSIEGHVPPEVAGDKATNNQLRYRAWFLTGFQGVFLFFYTYFILNFDIITSYLSTGHGALDFYTATCAAKGLCTPACFEGDLLNLYNKIVSPSVETYFRGWSVILCPEQAPTTLNWHVHGVVVTAPGCKISRKQIQDVMGPFDCRPLRGTRSQARDYCIKSGGMAVYVGDASVFDPEEAPLAKQAAIDWAHVINCCNLSKSFGDFKRRFITTGDNDCTRAAIARIGFIKEMIAANSPPRRIISHLLTLWQRALITACKDSPVASHRKIYWVWSTESGTGKSSVADLLLQHDISVFIWPGESSLKDAIYMYQDQQVVVCDVPRDGRVDNLYPILESVSDQNLVSAGKYQGCVKRFFSHTIVLSNFSPDHDRLPGRIQEINVKPLADENYEVTDVVSQLSFE